MMSKSKIAGFALVFISMVFSIHYCTARVPAPAESEVSLAAQSEVKNKAIMDVYNYVKEKRMTTLDDRCLSYDFDDSAASYFSVVVRETNRHGVCGSDSEVSAVLFRFHIDKRNWKMSTDAYSTDGGFSLVK
ncbi:MULTISPECIES: hypothetical protein [Serratia]|uniref:hypothetical protein n=1 Tax=Serratia TaxID=613 RepID=UPI0016487921|nr:MULTISPECIES: hypothetical protein [Serratia]MBC3216345.1 hypothetical protein [Serratia fonticola]